MLIFRDGIIIRIENETDREIDKQRERQTERESIPILGSYRFTSQLNPPNIF